MQLSKMRLHVSAGALSRFQRFSALARARKLRFGAEVELTSASYARYVTSEGDATAATSRESELTAVARPPRFCASSCLDASVSDGRLPDATVPAENVSPEHRRK